MPSANSRYIRKKYPPPEKKLLYIPYPNEVEYHARPKYYKREAFNIQSLIDFFKARITIEEIILAGLIIILLEEEVKDEFLLIMLVYILLF